MALLDNHGDYKFKPGNLCGLCCTKIERLGVAFGDKVILDGIDIHIHCGELTAIVGPNGAGKTTLLKALLGEVRHSGRINYLDAKGSRTERPVIGYVPQQMGFDRGSPSSVLDLFIAGTGTVLPLWLFRPKLLKKKAITMLEQVNSAHLLHRRLGELSGGELQRVFLSLALEPVPDILLLDEPVSGIDRNGLELFFSLLSDLLKKFDLSIILVSHDFNMVRRYADRVIFINRTVICNGTPDDVFSDKRFIMEFGKVDL